jgi:hypothetical protein
MDEMVIRYQWLPLRKYCRAPNALFNLKGQSHEIFELWFQTVPPGPLIMGSNGFAYRLEFAE